MTRKKRYLPLILVTLLFSACSEEFSDSDLKGVEAKIVFAGSEAADGCGWLLVLSDETTYKPESLLENFKIDDQTVKVTFKILDSSYSCGFPSINSPKFPNIRIAKIKKF